MGIPPNEWFIVENPVTMDDLGVTPISGNLHMHMMSQLMLYGIWIDFGTGLCSPFTIPLGSHVQELVASRSAGCSGCIPSLFDFSLGKIGPICSLNVLSGSCFECFDSLRTFVVLANSRTTHLDTVNCHLD